MATQHNHSHHEHSGTDLVSAAREALTGAGEQWTGMRESVFEELAKYEIARIIPGFSAEACPSSATQSRRSYCPRMIA